MKEILDKHRREATLGFVVFMAVWITVIVICIIGYDI
jgi:hypothetical protein